ncbi:MAG: tRNA uridine-5-carboxymethylaminomethyl(34) synthesis enzyme MnmG [Planctomycetota bacterium]
MNFDIIVIGAGHAGCEAALAASRMGANVLLLTISRHTVGQMSCNPAIGGLAKGQLVREIDALGGEMAKVTDSSMIQFRLLNTKKGHAVRSPRAQCDRKMYQQKMLKRIESQENLTLSENMVEEILVENKSAYGVRCINGDIFRSEAVILATGTFLRGVIHIGSESLNAGRSGDPACEKISPQLESIGFNRLRFKTGTPPRLAGETLNYDKLIVQKGDEKIIPFSFSTKNLQLMQVPCYITYTNEKTHKIIRENLNQSSLYGGYIKGATGARYCPSIEDKVVKFPHHHRHQIFIEPEGLDTTEVYLNGTSNSVPKEVQEKIVHSIDGLENAKITKYAYAIEYDCFDSLQIRSTYETKLVKNLYFAGQINGTSGYEEAAAQGLMAGINAVLKISKKDELILTRSESYIGTLTDDLVTLGVQEPYRMFTSRAEYRLLLRSDNADRRLMKYGHAFGLISDQQFAELQEKEEKIRETIEYLTKKRVDNKTLTTYLRHPENTFINVMQMDSHLLELNLPNDVAEQVEIEVKYEGYLSRQESEVRRIKNVEKIRIPSSMDFNKLTGLRLEAKEKLSKIRPEFVGQASRISGISPADISVLLVYIRKGSSPN